LSDVNITSPTQGDLLVYGSGTQWNNTKTLKGNYNFSGSVSVTDGGTIILTHVSQSLNFVNDAAAAVGGVPLGGLYRNGNVIQIRIT
jgi:hypothetical protein